MARSWEGTEQYAQKVVDTAGIVREAMLQQRSKTLFDRRPFFTSLTIAAKVLMQSEQSNQRKVSAPSHGKLLRRWHPAGVSPARPQSSRQAGSECCHSPGDWWVPKHTQQGSRPRRFSSENRLVAMPTLLTRRKAASGGPILRGRAGIAGVPSSGHASKGISQEPRRAPHLLLTTGGTGSQGKPEATGIDG